MKEFWVVAYDVATESKGDSAAVVAEKKKAYDDLVTLLKGPPFSLVRFQDSVYYRNQEGTLDTEKLVLNQAIRERPAAVLNRVLSQGTSHRGRRAAEQVRSCWSADLTS